MKWLTVDPGESTGWALWEDDELLEAGTMDGWEFVTTLSDSRGPGSELPFANLDLIVCEDWVLYPWSAEALIWDSQRTVRFIGAIELIAWEWDIELVLQPAKIKEAAEAGGAETYFLHPLKINRHANDAIRHGIYRIQTSKPGARTGHPTPKGSEPATRPQEKPQRASEAKNGSGPTPAGAP